MEYKLYKINLPINFPSYYAISPQHGRLTKWESLGYFTKARRWHYRDVINFEDIEPLKTFSDKESLIKYMKNLQLIEELKK